MATNTATSCIALTTIARPAVSQLPGAPAQSTSQQRTQTASPSTSRAQQTLQATNPTQPAQRPSTSRTSRSSARSRPPDTATVVEFLCKTWLGNAFAFLGFILTVVALAWTLYSGIIELKIQEWTAHNDALQACLSLENRRLSSPFCNETIAAGVSRPPVLKRHLDSAAATFNDDNTPYSLAAKIFWSVAAGVLTLVYMRPKTYLFRPIISMVRVPFCGLGAAWTLTWGFVSSHSTNGLIPSIILKWIGFAAWFWKNKRQDIHQDVIIYTDPTEEGLRIGLFYESDVEDDPQDQPLERPKHISPASQSAIDEVVSLLEAYCISRTQSGRFRLGDFNETASHFTPTVDEYLRHVAEHEDSEYFDEGVKAALIALTMAQFRELSEEVRDLGEDTYLKKQSEEEDGEEKKAAKRAQIRRKNQVSSTHDSRFEESQTSFHRKRDELNLSYIDGVQLRYLVRGMLPEYARRLIGALARRGMETSLSDLLEGREPGTPAVMDSWRSTIARLAELEAEMRSRYTHQASGGTVWLRIRRIRSYADQISAEGRFVLSTSGRLRMASIVNILREGPCSAAATDARGISSGLEVWEILPTLRRVEQIAEDVLSKARQGDDDASLTVSLRMLESIGILAENVLSQAPQSDGDGSRHVRSTHGAERTKRSTFHLRESNGDDFENGAIEDVLQKFAAAISDEWMTIEEREVLDDAGRDTETPRLEARNGHSSKARIKEVFQERKTILKQD